MVNFLSGLDSLDIKYVSWKNNHQISDALSGKSDLDILINKSDRAEFLKFVSLVSGIIVDSYVAPFKDIVHVYFRGGNGVIYHVHVYYDLITGNSWIKEYRLPLVKNFINDRVFDDELKVWVLKPSHQLYVFLIRHTIKCASIFGFILYRCQFKDYKSEYESIIKSIELPLENFDILNLDIKTDLNNRINKVELLDIFKEYKKSLKFASYRRYSAWQCYFKQTKSFFVRLFNKAFIKRDKVFKNDGFIIAISGVDGSGKSTMISSLRSEFSKFLSVQSIRLGKPYPEIMDGLLSKNKVLESNYEGKTRKNYKSQIKSLILAYLRYRATKKALKAKRKGLLVLSDRWPSIEGGRMDGPKLQSDTYRLSRSWFTRVLSILEMKFYRKMIPADIVFILKVNIESAMTRNQNRIKKNKETDIEIQERFMSNSNHNCITDRLVEFDNDGILSVKEEELKRETFEFISEALKEE